MFSQFFGRKLSGGYHPVMFFIHVVQMYFAQSPEKIELIPRHPVICGNALQRMFPSIFVHLLICIKRQQKILG